MVRRFHMRSLMPAIALLAAGMLGGCIAYPAYPVYGYGAPAPYYGGSYVAGGGGWHGGGGGWHGGGGSWNRGGGGWRRGGW